MNLVYALVGVCLVLVVVLIYFLFRSPSGTIGPVSSLVTTVNGTGVGGNQSNQSFYQNLTDNLSIYNTSFSNQSANYTNVNFTNTTAASLDYVMLQPVTLNAALNDSFNLNGSSLISGPGVITGLTNNYTSNSTIVTISLLQYNNSNYSHTQYNQSLSNFTSTLLQNLTYANAIYSIQNTTEGFSNGTVTNYQVFGVYGNFTLAINIAEFGTNITTSDVENLTNQQFYYLQGVQ
jgi:hypothetical protein